MHTCDKISLQELLRSNLAIAVDLLIYRYVGAKLAELNPQTNHTLAPVHHIVRVSPVVVLDVNQSK